MILAFSGYAGVGKDTAAQHLVEKFNFERRSFADPMRKMLYALDPWLPVGITVQEAVDSLGWEDAKKIHEVRRLLQRLGTEGGRQILGENIWVDTCLRDAPENLVIPDCRFPNEAETVKERGGWVVRIERDGYGPVNGHSSETALDEWQFDFTINNNKSESYLLYRVEFIIDNIVNWKSSSQGKTPVLNR